MNNKEVFSLVTGASSGIGKAIAYELASRGYSLLLISLPNENLTQVAEDIHEKYNVSTEYFEVDLSEQLGPKSVFNWVVKNNYKLNMLVNNAGMAGTSVFKECDEKYIDDRVMVNVRALAHLCRYFVPLLSQHEKAYILNVSSLSAYFAIPYKSLYSSTKSFVLNFSRAIRTELKETPVSVSVLCPNGVITNAGTYGRIEAHGKKAQWTSISPEKVARKAVTGCLSKRFLIIPGKINWFLLFLSRLIPRVLEQRILYNEFKKEVGA